ncbi:hypothetical protein HEP74_00674 [Xanthomonas sp. SS]|uniref:hypothetical protein n=1 Tax=Xanthomonas sp. SS TaxID=2724122 RepID=UPI00163AB9E9|nr:hypothetical protein [Xanthomonas sp. SS]QNH15551.1 hypothetical protein HEP74_00674 [Xanthomonas sp. SS]
MAEQEQSQTKESPLKATMSVVLKANDVVVAEVDDPVLWNAVFAAISSGRSTLAVTAQAQPLPLPSLPLPVGQYVQDPQVSAADAVVATTVANTPLIEPVQKFARELGVDINVLIGACDPSAADPFVTLDSHHWEAMRRDLPSRGAKAMSPIQLAASVLCLWARHAGIGSVTQSMAQNVLANIGCRDPNPGRGLDSSDWLQRKQGGVVAINPAKISKAIVVVAGFCNKDWAAWRAL